MKSASEIAAGILKNGPDSTAPASREARSRVPAAKIPAPPQSPEIGPIPAERVSAFLSEILRSYAFADFDPPAEEILVGMSLESAAEVKVPTSWIPRLFAVARREYRPVPKTKDLADCFRDHILEEIREAKAREDAASRVRLPPPPPPNPEEEFATMRDFFLQIQKIGVKLSPETREKYQI